MNYDGNFLRVCVQQLWLGYKTITKIQGTGLYFLKIHKSTIIIMSWQQNIAVYLWFTFIFQACHSTDVTRVGSGHVFHFTTSDMTDTSPGWKKDGKTVTDCQLLEQNVTCLNLPGYSFIAYAEQRNGSWTFRVEILNTTRNDQGLWELETYRTSEHPKVVYRKTLKIYMAPANVKHNTAWSYKGLNISLNVPKTYPETKMSVTLNNITHRLGTCSNHIVHRGDTYFTATCFLFIEREELSSNESQITVELSPDFNDDQISPAKIASLSTVVHTITYSPPITNLSCSEGTGGSLSCTCQRVDSSHAPATLHFTVNNDTTSGQNLTVSHLDANTSVTNFSQCHGTTSISCYSTDVFKNKSPESVTNAKCTDLAVPKEDNTLAIVLGVTIPIGFLIIVMIVYTLIKVYRLRKENLPVTFKAIYCCGCMRVCSSPENKGPVINGATIAGNAGNNGFYEMHPLLNGNTQHADANGHGGATSIGNQRLHFHVMGESGSGKSSTANSILMSKIFKVSSRPVPVTTELSTSVGSFHGQQYVVVDGPGLWCTSEKDTVDKMEAVTKRREYIRHNSNIADKHIFIYVFRIGQRMLDSDHTIEFYEKHFGKSIFTDSCVIVFRPSDKEPCVLEEYLSLCEGKLGELIDKCKNRVVLFDNVNTDENMQQNQLRNLFDILPKKAALV